MFLHSVLINEEELGHLLSNSCAMEKLELLSCNEIVRLEIPSTLSKLSLLRVLGCKILQAIEINATKLSTFHYGSEGLQYKIALATCCKRGTYICLVSSNVT